LCTHRSVFVIISISIMIDDFLNVSHVNHVTVSHQDCHRRLLKLLERRNVSADRGRWRKMAPPGHNQSAHLDRLLTADS
jgi:hypothetical protein